MGRSPSRHRSAVQPADKSAQAAPGTLLRAAVFDASGCYRYTLTRRWAPGGDSVAFVLLNPSTADAERDDPTIRRCMGFARDWGFAALEVVNLFAWRVTQPAGLRRAPDPVGPENDAHLLRVTQAARRVVLAWGIHGALGGRDAAVCALLASAVRRLECLGVTQGGHPRHVLYLPRDTRPVVYRPGAWGGR
ncbi:MAG TPA: DUF1643 domain-containing protein [bacterium]|nr:DUF1643 domain-containing protein [bacterium]